MNVTLKPFDFAQAAARAGLGVDGHPLARTKAALNWVLYAARGRWQPWRCAADGATPYASAAKARFGILPVAQ